MTTAVQRVAAYAVCVDDANRLLLCRLSDVTDVPGMWTLPGGGIDFGEHPEDAARREVFEETGYEARIEDVVAIDSARRSFVDNDTEFDYHSVRIVYRAEVASGSLTYEVGGSTDMAQWFSIDEAASVPLSDVARIGTRLAWGA
ncbi:MAG TPA: NUDIX hydrolase [Acidimicrobiia bacterium]|nr:NUDIX hydrolase [Acidimicrobiia bacterium]